MFKQISASAGSGKTYSLTRLFLTLLEGATTLPQPSGCAFHCPERGYSLIEILAATFTNKAAAEMKSRIISTLKESALYEGNASAGMWVDRILRHYGALNIRTIDSLLVALVRLSALDLGLSPDFEPSFEAEEYFTPLYDALMDDIASGDPASVHLTDSLDQACRSLVLLSKSTGFTTKGALHDRLHDLVVRMLEGQEVPVVDTDALHALIHARHSAFTAACTSIRALISSEKLQAAKPFLTFLENSSACDAYAGAPVSVYPYKEDFDACLNKASKGAASALAQRGFFTMSEAYAAYTACLPLLKNALQLAPLAFLAHELHTRMTTDQCSATLLPVIRIPSLASQALSGQYGVSDALCRLGANLTHLLLDEFQDTSREQWDALLPLAVECLSKGGSLTYVGDVKQAIYSWRGGDARLFGAALQEPKLLAVAPQPLQENLENNWRSHPVIIRHNNAFFSLLQDAAIARQVLAAMLPKDTPHEYVQQATEEAVRVFSQVAQNIPPERAEAASHEPESSKGHVRLYMVAGQTVAAVNQSVRERMRELFQEELFPPWEYGDVAVLVRSKKEALRVAEWLTEWGFPVVTENSFLLADNPLIGRLTAFLAFLDYPLDDLAFWEFASGPECLGQKHALSHTDLAAWLAHQAHTYSKNRPPLYQLFRASFPDIWELWLAPFHAEAGLMSAYDTLVEIIRRYTLLETHPEQAPFLLRFLEVAHLAETRGCSSLASFLAFWETCAGNEKLPLPESMNAIRIMTMHKAKGLEFPVVILPFQHGGQRHDPALAAVQYNGVPLLTRATKEIPFEYYPACITDELERLNLLYVAWTRPVYALHAFITQPQSGLASRPLAKGLAVLLEQYTLAQQDTLCEWEYLGSLESAGDTENTGEGDTEVISLSDCLERAASGGQRDDIPLESPFLQQTLRTISNRKTSPENDTKEDASASGVPPISPNVPQGVSPDISPDWRPMEWLPRLKIYRSTLTDATFTAARRGTLAHLCLEHLVLSPHAPAEQRLRDVTRAVQQGLRLFPLPVENPENVGQEMINCLFWFSGLPDAALWLAHGMREQGIIDTAGAMHRVDLLVDEARATEPAQETAPALHAIDYKTGSATERNQNEYHQQVQRYMKLVASNPFYQGRPVRGTLVYLDERRTEEVFL